MQEVIKSNKNCVSALNCRNLTVLLSRLALFRAECLSKQHVAVVFLSQGFRLSFIPTILFSSFPANAQTAACSRGRSRRLRGLDCSLLTATWRASDAGGRLGARQFPGILGRRNQDHSRWLRGKSAVYKDGGSRSSVMERARKAMATPVLVSSWGSLDGARRRCLRARVFARVPRGIHEI